MARTIQQWMEQTLDGMEARPGMYGRNVGELEALYHQLLELLCCDRHGAATPFRAVRTQLYFKLFKVGNVPMATHMGALDWDKAIEVLKELRRIAP